MNQHAVRKINARPPQASNKPGSSADTIYRELKEAIIDGSMNVGSWLVEAELAAKFNVSRTPVREALKRLVAERFAAHDTFRGTVVRGVDPREAAELGEMREVHEGLAARLAATRATEQHLNDLQYLQAQLILVIKTGRLSDAAALNSRFHEVLYDAAGNQRLAEVAGGLQDFVRRYTIDAIANPKRAADIVEEHERLIDALRRRHPADAEEAARAHCRACKAWSPS